MYGELWYTKGKMKKLGSVILAHWCLLAGVVFALLYWMVEASRYAAAFPESGFMAAFFPVKDVDGLMMRVLTTMLFVVLGAIANAMLTQLRRAHEEQKRLAEELQKTFYEIKALSKLLPICSVCKKVRSDSGYWQQVEDYFRDRSNALFSHGYCPECAAKANKEIDDLD